MFGRLVLAAVVFFAPFTLLAEDLGELGNLSGVSTGLVWRTRDASGAIINTALSRLRLRLTGTHDYSGGILSWLTVWDNEVLAGGLVKTPEFRALSVVSEPTHLDFNRLIASDDTYRWTGRITRASLAWDTGGSRLILGRQRFAWGSAKLWNPTDRFNPSSPIVLEPGEKTGVDALLVERYLSDFSILQFIGAPGNSARGTSQKLAARWQDTIGESDYTILGGKFGDELITGLDFTTNLLGGGLYFESTAGWPKKGNSSYVQFATGYETTWKPVLLADHLTLGVEYFRNTAATGQRVLALAIDKLQTRRRHFFGFYGGYQIGSLWRLSGTALFDTETGSRALIPSVLWMIKQNIEVEFLGQFFHGGVESEFGNDPDSLIIRTSAYF